MLGLTWRMQCRQRGAILVSCHDQLNLGPVDALTQFWRRVLHSEDSGQKGTTAHAVLPGRIAVF